MLDPEHSRYIITQQDNQLFRQIRIITGDGGKFNRWIVFVDCNGISDRETPVAKLIHDGFLLNGTQYMLSERSASMTRNSILSFVDASILDELNKRVTMGVHVEATVLSKYYAYRGLMLSACHCIEVWRPKVIVVPDCYRTVPNCRVRCLQDHTTTYVDENGVEREWTQKDVEEREIDLRLNLFDGCGMHHPAITAYVRHVLGMKENPTTLLLRMPYIKGVTHEMNYPEYYAEHGIAEITDVWGHKHSVAPDAEPMIILTESMYKGIKYFKRTGGYADWEEYWRRFEKYGHCVGITKWNFSKEREPVYTRANYQILQDLRMDYSDFAQLARDSVEWAERILSGDLLSICCFLGLTADRPARGLNSYCRAILKNPAMLGEEGVKKYLRRAIAKYIDEFKCGKLWLKGGFKFIAPDLIAMMQHIGGMEPEGCLADGEFYCHGIDGAFSGEYAIERNPHICASEHVLLNAVGGEREWVRWVAHLDNVCMLNSRGIVMQRLQGADCDGDLCFVTNNPIYMSGIRRDGIPVIDIDDKITTKPEEDTPENRSAVILRTMKNMIGEYSNYASVYHNKVPKTEEQRRKYEKYIDIIAVSVGKSIDYAKTGVLYLIPRHIAKYGRPLPYFMRYRGAYYANQKLARTASNMNRLCYDLEKWDRKLKWQKDSAPFDYRIMIDDSASYDQETYAAVRELYLAFGREMQDASKFQAMCRNYDRYASELSDQITKSEARNFEIDYGVYYRRYAEACAKVCPDPKVLANIAVRLCYEEFPKRDKKFLWAVAEKGILANLKQVAHPLPVRVYAGDAETAGGELMEYMGRLYAWETYGNGIGAKEAESANEIGDTDEIDAIHETGGME